MPSFNTVVAEKADASGKIKPLLVQSILMKTCAGSRNQMERCEGYVHQRKLKK